MVSKVLGGVVEENELGVKPSGVEGWRWNVTEVKKLKKDVLYKCRSFKSRLVVRLYCFICFLTFSCSFHHSLDLQ